EIMSDACTDLGRIPTLHVVGDSIPQAHFRAMKAVWENGLAIRGATAPARNTLSHANRIRSAQMAEDLFGAVLKHCTATSRSFGDKTYRGFPRRFIRMIHVVDSSTIQLIASCMDWAKHRRKKAAAKLHLRLNLQSFLPQFAIVDTAGDNDNKRARELCAGIGAGEIVLFDKAYVDFEHLCDLDAGGVSWVKRRIRHAQGRILRNDEIVLRTPATRKLYPQRLRRIHAIVERDGKDVEMVFIPTISCGRRKRSPICTSTVGVSKPSSNRSSRRCNCATFSGTARMRFCGKSGWPCWSMCSFGSWPISASGRTASPACSVWCVRPCGRAVICSSPFKAMGQHKAVSPAERQERVQIPS
ncbi:MAG: transposase, partial [Candidatus Hydrogenedentes bacterium]|nr:transposase [Candidatus Hydrogenedentota bacterium]